MTHRRALHVLLPTLGSSGDVHPFIALGSALQARGHRATLLTNPIFQPLIDSQGLGFLPVGSADAAHAAVANPDLWHLRKGFKIIARVIVPAIAEIYRLIENHAGVDTVVAYSTLAFGARVAQEKLGVPSASVHLQPSVIRTYADQGMLGNIRLSAAHPRWFKHGLFGLADALVLDRSLKQPLNQFRETLGLAPIDRVMYRWMHSPQMSIAFFPEWFAAPQPDWPPHTHAVGFPLWDAGDAPQAAPSAGFRSEAGQSSSAAQQSSSDAEEFLSAGAPPIVFTPGSAGSTMQRFFSESVIATQRLGMRAMLITNFPEQVPRNLPPDIKTFGYLPFSRVLPRASLLVYHGGIGTLAQAIGAGVPHLVVPHGYDQFDNGWRIERLGLGHTISQARYRAQKIQQTMRRIFAHDSVQRRREFAARIDSAGSLTRACELIEGLRA